MNVLWITNIPFGPLCELGNIDKSSSGSWLDAAYASLEFVEGVKLTIVTVSNVKERKVIRSGKHSFYILPGGYPSEYDYRAVNNSKEWMFISQECKPDLIQIWGTEYTHGYHALKIMHDIPSVIYMQGVLSQVSRYYLAGISDKELLMFITLRDVLKWDWIKLQQNRYFNNSRYEALMIKKSCNVIVENNWCKSQCQAIEPNCNVYKSKLTIKQEFYNENWDINKMTPFSIMCNAGGYPLKGLHVLLNALNIVVKKYPNVQLLIPGDKSPFEKNYLERLKTNGYSKYLKSIILKHKLKDNIKYLGVLSSIEMARQMAMSNVFVLPSCIENHSSTLIEAMIVGTPCIATNVGGIPEFVKHETNGLLYRFEDYEILALHICKIFKDINFSITMANCGKMEMRKTRQSSSIKDELISIYTKILQK